MTHGIRTTPMQPSPGTEPWPDGVTARYLTVAGATVDVRGSGDNVSMTCLGCDLGYSAFGEARTRELAQGHAEKCRALPRPAVTG
ncbi:hypothetical protein [Streptomyces sp. NPDC001914]|uniref:hypothetical protein n=1 Tax=Streptomyces sp. NPDC001914 TaxID=3364623 RepID=UPI0036CEF130